MSVLTIDDVFPKGVLSFSSVGSSKSNSTINEILNLAKTKQKENFTMISSDNKLVPFLTVLDYMSLGTNKPSKYVKEDLLDILPEFKLDETIINSKIISLTRENNFFIQLIFALLSQQDYLLIDNVSSNKAIEQLDSYYDLLNFIAKKYNVAITIVSSIY